VFSGERLEFADDFRVPPEHELGLDPLFERREPKLVEPAGLDAGEPALYDVAQRCSPPESQSLP